MNQDFLKTILSNKKVETSALTDEEDKAISDAIKKWIKEKNYGKNYIEIYADYRDELPKKDIQKILEAKNPSDMFYDIVSDYYATYYDSEEYKLVFEELDLDEDFKEDYIDNIYEILWEELPIEYPYDHFLRTKVPVDVYVNESEASGEEMLTFDDDGKVIAVARPLVWLLERQGYSVEEFLDYYNSLENFDRGSGKTNYDTNTFFGSLVQEADNYTGGGYAQVVFLGSIDLEDYIKGFEYVHIPKDAICGLVDTYNGAGSVLEVNLEKPINLPKNEVSIYHKNGYRYSVDEIYGLSGSAWKADIQLKGSEE